MDNYQQMIDMLTNERGLLLVGHEDADADSLGSVLALYHAFNGADKGWVMLLNDPQPEHLRYLPGLSLMRRPEQVDFSACPAVLLVDCGRPERAGAYLPPLIAGKRLYCIDHHISTAFSGQLSLVEPQAAAAAELVAVLIEQAKMPLTPDIALCLYTGLAADTGCFRYNNTTPRCLRLAGWLRPLVDIETVRIQLFEARSWPNLKMMATCLENIQVECEGRLAYSWLTRAERERHQARAEDCHNIVNYTLVLAGVKLGMMFEEYEDTVKISFRSRSGYRVDKLATAFGGGGHLMASGCTVAGSLEQVLPQVVAEAKKILTEE